MPRGHVLLFSTIIIILRRASCLEKVFFESPETEKAQSAAKLIVNKPPATISNSPL